MVGSKRTLDKELAGQLESKMNVLLRFNRSLAITDVARERTCQIWIEGVIL